MVFRMKKVVATTHVGCFWVSVNHYKFFKYFIYTSTNKKVLHCFKIGLDLNTFSPHIMRTACT